MVWINWKIRYNGNGEIMEWLQYLIILTILIIIAAAIVKSKNKNFKIEVNKLVSNLGGIDNIESYEFNKSRFIVNLKNVTLVNKEAIQKMGAQGIVEIENQLKIIIGENANELEHQINDLMKRK